MLRRITLAVALVGAAGCASSPRSSAPGDRASGSVNSGQQRSRVDIAYRIAMSDPASHLYEVQLDLEGVRGDTLRLQLPVWSPGRYARFDFARNVQDFAASDIDGRRLEWDKENGSLWRVYPGTARAVRVRYRVYANTLSGTFSVLDTAHANWNGASVFMYVVGHKQDPVRLRVSIPPGWRLANGESRTLDQTDFSFPNYDLLIDTPNEVAPAFDIDTFRMDGRLYRVMVHHNGPQRGQRARFVRDVERIVRYQNAVMGPPPLEMYTFLFNIGYAGGDGMEHLYSTQVINPSPWTDTAVVLPGISTGSHEYFHVWNVKRIRPTALGPFDYSREQYQTSLWVAEGWTQYYGHMTLHRAGIIDRGRMYGMLSNTLGYTLEAPGRKEVSVRMGSFHAPFWDGAPPPMGVNGQTFISYYTKGAALAWLLDLEIRGRTGNTKSLDDVLRLLKERTWQAPATSYYLQGRGYTEADVERAVSDVAGADFHPWFERYVGGVDDLPWTETLALAGLRHVATQSGAERQYRLEEIASASPAQVQVREGWLTGRVQRVAPSPGVIP